MQTVPQHCFNVIEIFLNFVPDLFHESSCNGCHHHAVCISSQCTCRKGYWGDGHRCRPSKLWSIFVANLREAVEPLNLIRWCKRLCSGFLGKWKRLFGNIERLHVAWTFKGGNKWNVLSFIDLAYRVSSTNITKWNDCLRGNLRVCTSSKGKVSWPIYFTEKRLGQHISQKFCFSLFSNFVIFLRNLSMSSQPMWEWRYLSRERYFWNISIGLVVWMSQGIQRKTLPRYGTPCVKESPLRLWFENHALLTNWGIMVFNSKR